ncbi:MAG TPA: LysR substrate-binding domain-containing protein [Streptosporangiaceae bacterium]
MDKVRQLEYFLAVAEELHFGRAAERLHVVQQSVSEQIQALERALGGRLFERTSRRVRLTALGEAFLPEARRATEQVAHAYALGRKLARGEDRVLTIGYAEDFGGRIVAALLGCLAAAEPVVEVEPQVMSADGLVEALRGGRLDAALLWGAEPLPDLVKAVLVEEPLVVALRESHPLAAQRRIAPADLRAVPLALWSRATNPRLFEAAVTLIGGDGHAGVRVVQETDSLSRRLTFALAGRGAVLALAHTAAATPATGIVYRRFTDPEPAVPYALARRSEDSRQVMDTLVRTALESRGVGASGSPPPV